MSKRIITRENDMLDDIVWRHYGRHDALDAVLEANPELARLAPLLPAGLTITLPDLPTPSDAPVIRLWS